MPKYTYTNPNILLRQICDFHGYDNKMLQSVNGVMAAANSAHGREYSDEEMYNWCKYRFITDSCYMELVRDGNFDKYVVNKIISMKIKRMAK